MRLDRVWGLLLLVPVACRGGDQGRCEGLRDPVERHDCHLQELSALLSLDVDGRGLDKMDCRILTTIINLFNGGPVGVDTVAAAIGEQKDTLEDVYEPYLIQQGYLARTARGRLATDAAYLHFGLERKEERGSLL